MQVTFGSILLAGPKEGSGFGISGDCAADTYVPTRGETMMIGGLVAKCPALSFVGQRRGADFAEIFDLMWAAADLQDQDNLTTSAPSCTLVDACLVTCESSLRGLLVTSLWSFIGSRLS